MKQPSIIRAAHGNGASAIIRAEAPPLDEIPPPEAITTGRQGRPFEKGNTAAKNKKPALCLLGQASNEPRLRSAQRKANAYRRRRCAELAAQCGGYLSAGASGMIAASARDLANAQIVQELADAAFERGDHDTAVKMYGQASRLSDQSRQKELTAIGIAEREAKARGDDWEPLPWPSPESDSTADADALTVDELDAARREGLL